MATRAATRGRTLVVAAWDPELRWLRRALDRSPVLARRLVTRAVGVGLIEAAIGTARAIGEIRPARLIFVGTAGRYPRTTPSLATGQAALAGRVQLASGEVLREEAYFPRPLPTAIDTDEGLRRAIAAAALLPVADVACPLAITSSRASARRLAGGSQCSLENLEVFAVARAAAPLPFAAVLGISNEVGPQAHAEWKTFAATASRAACQAILAWIRA